MSIITREMRNEEPADLMRNYINYNQSKETSTDLHMSFIHMWIICKEKHEFHHHASSSWHNCQDTFFADTFAGKEEAEEERERGGRQLINVAHHCAHIINANLWAWIFCFFNVLLNSVFFFCTTLRLSCHWKYYSNNCKLSN